jgi:hypothetical protein
MVLYAQFREVFLTKRYLGIAMEYAAGGDMFDFFVRNKAFVNVKVLLAACLPLLGLHVVCRRCCLLIDPHQRQAAAVLLGQLQVERVISSHLTFWGCQTATSSNDSCRRDAVSDELAICYRGWRRTWRAGSSSSSSSRWTSATRRASPTATSSWR